MNLIAYINLIALAITVLMWLELTVRTYEGEDNLQETQRKYP